MTAATRPPHLTCSTLSSCPPGSTCSCATRSTICRSRRMRARSGVWRSGARARHKAASPRPCPPPPLALTAVRRVCSRPRAPPPPPPSPGASGSSPPPPSSIAVYLPELCSLQGQRERRQAAGCVRASVGGRRRRRYSARISCPPGLETLTVQATLAPKERPGDWPAAGAGRTEARTPPAHPSTLCSAPLRACGAWEVVAASPGQGERRQGLGARRRKKGKRRAVDRRPQRTAASLELCRVTPLLLASRGCIALPSTARQGRR